MTHILQLCLLLALVIAAAKLSAAAANRIGQPAVFGEILAGLILGPTVLNVLGWPIFAHAATPPHGTMPGSLLGSVRDLAEVGVILLMFVAGLETDLAEMRRVGKVAFWAAFGGVVLPLVAGAVTAVWFGLPLFWTGLFIGTILTATSVSISAQTLMELNALRSREGTTILGAAVIDDVMGIILLSVVVALARRRRRASDAREIAWMVVRMARVLRGRARGRARCSAPSARGPTGWRQPGPARRRAGGGVRLRVGGRVRRRRRRDHRVVPRRRAVRADPRSSARSTRASTRSPTRCSCRSSSSASACAPTAASSASRSAFTVALVVVAIVTKALGCGLFARLFGFSTRESVRVGVGMISRGEVGLIVAGYGLANGLIGPDVFSASVIMVLATTMVTPAAAPPGVPARRRPRATSHGRGEPIGSRPPHEAADRDRLTAGAIRRLRRRAIRSSGGLHHDAADEQREHAERGGVDDEHDANVGGRRPARSRSG